MIRRITAFVFALIFGWTVSTQSARAFAPVAVLGAPQIVAVGGEVYALAAMAGLIGITGLYSLMGDSEGNQVRVPLSNDSAAVPPAPVAPNQVSVSGGGTSYEWAAHDSTWGSLGSVCSKYTSQPARDVGYGTTRTFQCVSISSNGGTGTMYTTYRDVNPGTGLDIRSEPYLVTVYSRQVAIPLSCADGYTLSGSTCTLADARQAQSDRKIDYKRENGAYVPVSPNDADKNTAPKHGNQNGAVAWAGKTMDGYPTQSIQVVNPNGSSQIHTQISRPNGTLETQTLTFSPSGEVIGFTTTQTAASLQINPDTGTATVQAPAPVVNPDGSVNTSVQPSSSPQTQQTIQFPNDYARTGEAESAARPTRDKLSNSEDVRDPALPLEQAFNDAFFIGTFSQLLGWSMPAHASQCPTSSFFWNNAEYTIDSHCQMISNHWGVLQSAMAVVWVIAALFVVLGA